MRSFRAGFTLIELLIVIGIIAIIGVITVLVVNPAELFARARDTERMSELQTINRAVQHADLNGLSEGTPQTVYVSLPDSSPTCASYALPALTSGWTYACSSSANYRKVNGTGWIPVNFASINIGILSTLPIDPVNTLANSYYYTYTPGGSWVLTAKLESAQQLAEAAVTDNGVDTVRFEIGTDINLWSQSGAANASGGESDPPPSGPPTVTSASPSSKGQAATNQTVLINGTNFASGATVSFSGNGITINSTSYVSATQLSVNMTISSSATTSNRDITVTSNSQQASCNNCFTINNNPGLPSASPSSGTVGTTADITINGSAFVNGATVSFSGSGITVNSVTFVSASRLTANITIASNTAQSSRDITVTNPDAGVRSCTTCFTVVLPAPTITSVSPTSGSRGATLTLTINGTNFVNGATVDISGSRITINSTNFVSATQMTASISIASNAGKTARDVTVDNPDGQDVTLNNSFTVTD